MYAWTKKRTHAHVNDGDHYVQRREGRGAFCLVIPCLEPRDGGCMMLSYVQ